eukprot:6198388-Pleurochrysis_carterae.AAC.1
MQGNSSEPSDVSEQRSFKSDEMNDEQEASSCIRARITNRRTSADATQPGTGIQSTRSWNTDRDELRDATIRGSGIHTGARTHVEAHT